MDGKSLELIRRRADLTAKQVGLAMGYKASVASSSVSRMEARRHNTPVMVDRYLAAIATLTTNTTSPGVEEGAA